MEARTVDQHLWNDNNLLKALYNRLGRVTRSLVSYNIHYASHQRINIDTCN